MSPVPAFRLQGISRSYATRGPEVVALRATDLTLARGSYTAVVGRSGSGKSTLLNIIGLLDRPTSGRLEVLGVDVDGLKARERHALRSSALGFVFQAFHLIAGRSVTDNVDLGLVYQGTARRERRLAAERMLHRVGLEHRLDADVTTLSGGERQRVAIARALCSGAEVLLCDEPTGNLDESTERSVMDLLGALHREGKTIIVVTHNAQVAARADQVLNVSDGVVTAAPRSARVDAVGA